MPIPSLTKVLGSAALFSGGTTIVSELRDWRHTLGSLPLTQAIGKSMENVVLQTVEPTWPHMSFEGVMMPRKLAYVWLLFSHSLRAFNTYQNTQHTL